MSEQRKARWVYCVVAACERPSLEGLHGVDPSSPVELVEEGDLAAFVSAVSLDEFGSDALRRNLEDMAWLERTARAHQAVLDRALESATAVVPMRLCTIFDDAGHVRWMLESEREVLLDALKRVRDHCEWSVKVLVDPDAAAAAARTQGTPAEAGATGGAGHAYLARKRQERFRRERSRALVEEAVEGIHGRLSEEAEAIALLPPQRRELSGRSGEMVLNGAYLVHRSRVDAFKTAVEELRTAHRDLGLELDVSGPWAPYNFVAAEQPA